MCLLPSSLFWKMFQGHCFHAFWVKHPGVHSIFTCFASNKLSVVIMNPLSTSFTSVLPTRMNMQLLTGFLALTFMQIISTSEAGSVQLQMSRVTHGLKSTSGVIKTIQANSVYACALVGSSFADCHAINYHTVDQTCEIISSHDAALQIQIDGNNIFAAFNNTYDQQQTGVERECAVGPVQWKNQYKSGYVVYPNLVCSNGEENCVCKVTVGDNEVPGVLISTKQCLYVYKGQSSFAALYRTLHVDEQSQLTASWVSYTAGIDVPERSFIGGHSAQDTPFYVCRAQIGNAYYTGYYDPTTGTSNINYHFLLPATHPTSIELLVFNPDGPVSSGPIIGYPCPRYQVRQVSTGYELKEHWSKDPLPAGYISEHAFNWIVLGVTWAVSDVIAQFNSVLKAYWMGYGELRGGQLWGQMLLPSLPYEFVPFQVGSDVPYNAPVIIYTHENDPLYVVMKEEYGFAFGSYNSRAEMTDIEYNAEIRHPTDVHILTFSLSPNSKAWSDEGYHIHSGPITAIRIQHDSRVTGIQCRFGAQWAAGFWSNMPGKTITEVNLNQNEFIKAVGVSILNTLDSITFFTNIQPHGPFGVDKGGQNETMISRCGQVHHFSGYLQWDEGAQDYKTFSFAVHGDSCSWIYIYKSTLRNVIYIYIWRYSIRKSGGGGVRTNLHHINCDF